MSMSPASSNSSTENSPIKQNGVETRISLPTDSYSSCGFSHYISPLGKVLVKLKKLNDSNYSPNINVWNGNLEDSTVGLEAFTIRGSDLIKLPLKSTDVQRLMKNFPPSTCECQSKESSMGCTETAEVAEIDGSLVTLLPSSSQTLSQIPRNLAQITLEKMLNIEFDCLSFNISAKLEKLVICQEGGSYQSSFASRSPKECGKFGTLLLKLPVEGQQFCGGKVIVNHGTNKTSLIFETKKNYSVTALTGGSSKAGKQSYTVKAGLGEPNVLLVFSMVWQDHRMLFLHGFPSMNYFSDMLVLTHEIKSLLMLWSRQSETNHAEFMCLPILKVLDAKKELGFSNLSAPDLVIATSLTAISFLDVNFALITQEGFKQGTFSPFSIKDNLFQSTITDDKNFIGKRPEEIIIECPVFVIRPRNPNLLLPVPRQSIVELLIESLESRLSFVDCVMEKPTLHRRLLKDLEQIFEVLEDESQQSNLSCQTCLYSRLFIICIRLDAMPQRIMKIFSKFNSIVDFFILDCGHSMYKPTNVFFDFMCKADGWTTCSSDLERITGQLLKKRGFRVLSEIGIKLLQFNYVIIASEIFNWVLGTFEEMPQKDIDEAFDAEMAVFAIHLHENNEPDLEVFLDLLENLQPRKLIELVEHLRDLHEEKVLDCTFTLRKLGKLRCKSNFFGFKPDQFWKITQVYQSIGEKDLVNASWTSVCNQCIEISKRGDETTSCLFCNILETQPSNEFLSGLSSTPNAKEALTCSIRKLHTLKAQNFKLANHISYVVSLTLLEGSVSKDEILKQLSHFYTLLKPKVMCKLSNSLVRSEMNAIQDQRSTLHQIHECLLNLIVNLEANVLAHIARRIPILESFAWHGGLNLLKVFVGKIACRDLFRSDKQLLNLISNLFKSAESWRTKSTSTLLLNRDIFNYLILEWLKAIQIEGNRNGSLFECFKHFADGERSFIDSTEAVVISEWKRIVESLPLNDALIIVICILDFEMGQDGASLKKFPCCWEVFSSMCRKALSLLNPIDPNVSADHLVSLMQSFFWIGDEKGISEMCGLFRNVTHESLVEVHRRILSEKRTLDLAFESPHALLALNDLIDARVEYLNRRLAELFAVDVMCRTKRDKVRCQRCYESNSGSFSRCLSHTMLNLPTLHVRQYCGRSEAVSNFLNEVHHNYRWADNTEFQAEINTLNALRRTILERTLICQAQANSTFH